MSRKDIINANEHLFKIAKLLKQQKYRVKILKVGGTVKGHLDCFLWDEHEIEKSNTLEELIVISDCGDDDDYVLFVYC